MTTCPQRIAAILATIVLALPSAQAGCKYKKLGSVPLHWEGTQPLLEGSANGVPVRVLVDTGADNLILTEELADKLKLDLGHLGHDKGGVGGTTRVSRSHVAKFTLGKFVWNNAPFLVVHQHGKDVPEMIVGARFLMQKDVEMTADALTWFEPSDCDDVPLGYWAADVPFVELAVPTEKDPHLVARVQVNGRPVRAVIDTGASRTVLDLATARELGFDAAAPGVTRDSTTGFGQHEIGAWIGRFDTIAVGPEVVHKPRIMVMDLWGAMVEDSRSVYAAEWSLQQAPMLLGADFLKSHRVLFAASQHRMYFSYNGGELFAAPAEVAGSASAAGH